MEINDENKIMFIGDTIYSDIRLAEESGFRSCLVLTGNSSRDTLKSYVTEPDHVINNLEELKEILSLN
jgi:ribonucleotide monophosphatase NagD (HAD superfamily)